jgi:hypothetical protein
MRKEMEKIREQSTKKHVIRNCDGGCNVAQNRNYLLKIKLLKDRLLSVQIENERLLETSNRLKANYISASTSDQNVQNTDSNSSIPLEIKASDSKVKRTKSQKQTQRVRNWNIKD